MAAFYILHGLNPSPYSVKMRAILRYRRIPFVWRATGHPRDVAVAAGLPPVIPVLQFPDGRPMNDSTPLAHALEREHPGEQSIVPDDPVQAYLNDLLEDFGDEWVTKMMFHYRWYHATPMAEMRGRAPDVYCWLLRLDDASGVDGTWRDPSLALPSTLTALLEHCGETYLPFLAANTRALQAGADEVTLDIQGRPYTQAPFRYQAKCHDALRKKLAALAPDVRRRLDPLLEQAGCLTHLA